MISLENLYPIEKFFFQDCETLLTEMGCLEMNIRYSVFCDHSGWHRIVQYIPASYPTDQMYAKGVKTKTRLFNREAPNKKVMTEGLLNMRNDIDREEVYDFLCYDEHMQLLEGTKTNVFFIVDGIIYTAPDHKVLGGITRKVICEVLEENGALGANDNILNTMNLGFKYEALPLSLLGKVTAAFLTGTSIGVLPISQIDNYELQTVEFSALQALMAMYRDIESRYISSN